MSDGPIDAVFTWVDGSDPTHLEKRKRYARLEGVGGLARDATADTRFADAGELHYAVHLLRRNAPWVRKIFIITDAQCPPWLTPNARARYGVELVDHRDLFVGYESFLPTFSSRSIEAMLHRVPGIAERFLYLNDDFFVFKPVKIGDYFNGKRPRLRGARRLHNQFGFAVQWVLAQAFGYGRRYGGLVGRTSERSVLGGTTFFAPAHAPHAICRRAYATLMAEQDLADLLGRRFRTPGQLRPLTFYASWLLRERRAEMAPVDWIYREPGNRLDLNALAKKDAVHLCVQSMDRMTREERAKVFEFLRQAGGEPVK